MLSPPGELCVPLLGFLPQNFESLPIMVAPGDIGAPGDLQEDGEATDGLSTGSAEWGAKPKIPKTASRLPNALGKDVKCSDSQKSLCQVQLRWDGCQILQCGKVIRRTLLKLNLVTEDMEVQQGTAARQG